MVDIKALMFDKSLSQRRLAEIMNTSQSEVSQIANAKRRILRKHIDGLIDFFGEETISKYMVSEKPQVDYVEDSDSITATLVADDDAQYRKMKTIFRFYPARLSIAATSIFISISRTTVQS